MGIDLLAHVQVQADEIGEGREIVQAGDQAVERAAPADRLQIGQDRVPRQVEQAEPHRLDGPGEHQPDLEVVGPFRRGGEASLQSAPQSGRGLTSQQRGDDVAQEPADRPDLGGGPRPIAEQQVGRPGPFAGVELQPGGRRVHIGGPAGVAEGAIEGRQPGPGLAAQLRRRLDGMPARKHPRAVGRQVHGAVDTAALAAQAALKAEEVGHEGRQRRRHLADPLVVRGRHQAGRKGGSDQRQGRGQTAVSKVRRRTHRSPQAGGRMARGKSNFGGEGRRRRTAGVPGQQDEPELQWAPQDEEPSASCTSCSSVSSASIARFRSSSWSCLASDAWMVESVNISDLPLVG